MVSVILDVLRHVSFARINVRVTQLCALSQSIKLQRKEITRTCITVQLVIYFNLKVISRAFIVSSIIGRSKKSTICTEARYFLRGETTFFPLWAFLKQRNQPNGFSKSVIMSLCHLPSIPSLLFYKTYLIRIKCVDGMQVGIFLLYFFTSCSIDFKTNELGSSCCDAGNSFTAHAYGQKI